MIKEKWEVINKFDEDYGWLSNFFPSPLEYNKRISGLLNLNFQVGDFRTVEHAYQAAKTRNCKKFEDIRLAKTPGRAKRLGGRISKEKTYLRQDWYKIQIDLMEELLRIKFSNSYFKDKLLQTGDINLIEGNHWHDNFFGDCFCQDCKKKKGKNILGKLLMKTRDEIKEGKL